MKANGIIAIAVAIVLVGAVIAIATYRGTRETSKAEVTSPAGGTPQVVVGDQVPSATSLTVARVVAPQDSWVVVHKVDANGMPGVRVGRTHVRAGLSENVRVKLELETPPPQLLVALHLDAGTPGTFDVNMENSEQSLDKPVVVNGKVVAALVRLP